MYRRGSSVRGPTVCDRGSVALLGALLVAAIGASLAGCEALERQTDRDVAQMIRERQRRMIGREADADLRETDYRVRAGRDAYRRRATPTTDAVPPDFTATAPPPPPATQPGQEISDRYPAVSIAPRPRDKPFTLTEALSYAQQHRREYQTAKEQLYGSALALTLERHLWTPIFTQQFQTVYGNYGEDQHFDQAMRFVHDASLTQRLPFGGDVAVRGISTLIRDVKKTLTASEGSQLDVTVRVPLLQGAGMVAQESLIQLERELTYSVRVFERFRRQQVAEVAQNYFDLLRIKQSTYDTHTRYERAQEDFERAKALEQTGKGTPLDTQRAEQAKLSAENSYEIARENFRGAADEFKLLIGMPVDESLGVDDLEDITTIEQHVSDGAYPVLAVPAVIREVDRAIQVGLERRLDLITLHDRIDDARRGVSISRNALLPKLDWQGSVNFTTDPNHYSMTHFAAEHSDWFTQITLEMPWERTKERNDLRQKLIAVRAAQRAELDQAERIRVEVRRVANLLRLADISLEIQERSLQVAMRRSEFAQLQFEEGLISNRDKLEAEDELLQAQNALNQAKTSRWTLLLQFRLATETLRVEEDGSQLPDPESLQS